MAQARTISIGTVAQHSKHNDSYGKKTYRFCNLPKWKNFNRKQLTLLQMCVTSLLCGPQADLWQFHCVLCKRFSLPYESLYFECYATMPMLTNAYISSLGYEWFLHAWRYEWQFLFRTVRPGQTTVRRVVTRMK